MPFLRVLGQAWDVLGVLVGTQGVPRGPWAGVSEALGDIQEHLRIAGGSSVTFPGVTGRFQKRP